jgi:hypothetical protein
MFGGYITKISPAKQFLISFLEPRFQLLKKLNRRARGARRAKDRKIGMMDCWNIGKPIVSPTIPLFHCSISFRLFRLCALCLLFVHPLVFNPGGSKGKEESLSIK